MVINPATGETHVFGNVKESISLPIPSRLPTLQGCVDQYLQTERLDTPLESYPNCTNTRIFFKGKAPEAIQFSLKKWGPDLQKIQSPIKGFDQPIRVPFSDDPTAAYQVDAVVCQSGNTRTGHYFALVRTFDGWLELNDRNERSLSEKEGLAIIETNGYLVKARKI